ncbi:hypothetical protein QPK31_05660 [Massilia sp. YIM B02769]|jgi:hypothetical protein|uniref:hypothetical protein n=1 Tax=unclassified Massilia TaxID=2609279 RepID=UPI0025B72805|nr:MULTISPECIES: hypothetical protein [unclassified Massilia]MDN4057712.1 hypothetical protein [Massilia sp. YIM B02769]
MSTMNAYPSPVYPAMPMPFFGMWSDVAGLYREVVKTNTEQLFLSSAKVIQEQMLRAVITAAQSCTDALAKNALSVQQQSMERFAEANGKAVGLMGQAFTRVWMGSLPAVK